MSHFLIATVTGLESDSKGSDLIATVAGQKSDSKISAFNGTATGLESGSKGSDLMFGLGSDLVNFISIAADATQRCFLCDCAEQL